MSYESTLTTISLLAAADLSALQYTFVDVNSSGQAAAPSGAGAACLGVLQNDPDAANKVSAVAIAGVSKVKLGATVAAGASVMTDANGAAITATATNVILGRALAGGDAGEIVPVALVSKATA